MPYLAEGKSASDDVHRDAMRTTYRGDYIVIISKYEDMGSWDWAQLNIKGEGVDLNIRDLRELSVLIAGVADRLAAEEAEAVKAEAEKEDA